MEGWVDLGYQAVRRPGVELAIYGSWFRRYKHYTIEPVATMLVDRSKRLCITLTALNNVLYSCTVNIQFSQSSAAED